MFALTLFLTTLTCAVLVLLLARNRKNSTEPPAPTFKLPIVGHLHLMAGYDVPYEAFTALSKKLGDVFQLQLGYVKCVVINGQKNIREALVTKGHHFDSRPNFQRYQQLFCGNKENSLAFCNWSNTQKTRRDMLKAHTFPRAFTDKFSNLENLISDAAGNIIAQIETQQGNYVAIKSAILKSAANIFTSHFCSKNFSVDNADFAKMVSNYDDIFYEVNQGYAADFLPFLMPLHSNNLKRVNTLTHEIREFVLDHIIEDRYDSFDIESEPEDYVDSLIKHVKNDDGSDLTWDAALYALEDIIGGHSAVGNFLVKLLAFIAKEPEVQRKIAREISDNIGKKPVTISDRPLLPYTEATIYEAIRLIASPIVPRVANRDSTVNGYKIEQGTLIFLNNHDLSMSPELWDDPAAFKPERFIREGRLVKPEHFLPFGGGRRSCMGYKMVQLVSFGLMGGLVQKYHVIPKDTNYQVPAGSLALPRDTFQFRFEARAEKNQS